MSVEILYPDGAVEMRTSISFAEIGKVVGGFIECVTIYENGEVTQCLMNEDGRRLRQHINNRATKRFAGKINNAEGAVGPWVILKGEDLLK